MLKDCISLDKILFFEKNIFEYHNVYIYNIINVQDAKVIC